MRLKDHFARLVELLDDCPFIASRRIDLADRPPDAQFIQCKIVFIDDSRLLLKEFTLQKGNAVEILKYGYHYENNSGELIVRYDNALDPAARKLPTWPHHRHTQQGIEASEQPGIEDLLDEITAQIHR